MVAAFLKKSMMKAFKREVVSRTRRIPVSFCRESLIER